MTRRARQPTERAQQVYQVIDRQPGIHAAHIARELGLPQSAVNWALVGLEVPGWLVCEDKGKLYPYRESEE